MASEWPLKTLDELGVTLIDCVHKTPKAEEKGVPYIGIPQMKEGTIDFDASPRLISEKDFKKWTEKANPLHGDIVLSRRCNPGETAYVPKGVKFALGQNLVLLRPDKEKLHPGYLRWVVKSNVWWNEVEKYRNPGAIFDSLKCADIPRFRIPEPPRKVQEEIDSNLSAISDKIELNKKINQTLEQMAQAMFKSWFVDFDPVFDNLLEEHNNNLEKASAHLTKKGAEDLIPKLQQRHQIQQTSDYKPLPDHIKKEFPNDFQHHEDMGWIPGGWKVLALDKVANYQNGLALQKFRPRDESKYLPVVKIAQLKKGYADGEEKASPDIKPECVINNGDVIFSWSGSLIVDIWYGGKAALNQHLFKVTSDKYPKWLYYYYTKHHLNSFQKIAADKAVTMGHIKRSHLSEALCVIPNGKVFEIVSSKLSPLLTKQETTSISRFKLIRLRDLLLPKLINGELTLGN